MLGPAWLCFPAQLFSPVPTGLLGIGPGKGVGPTYFWWLVSSRSTAAELGGPGGMGRLRQMGNVPGRPSSSRLVTSSGTGWILVHSGCEAECPGEVPFAFCT